MKYPSAMDQILFLLRKYFFLVGITLSLLLTLTCSYAWTAHRPFNPEKFTAKDDPSLKSAVENCHITGNTISISGWLHSDLWPSNGASMVLTAGEGDREFSILYRLQERPDIAQTFHTEANAFHSRYGFTGIARNPTGTTSGTTIHLNIISGHRLYRISHACRS